MIPAAIAPDKINGILSIIKEEDKCLIGLLLLTVERAVEVGMCYFEVAAMHLLFFEIYQRAF